MYVHMYSVGPFMPYYCPILQCTVSTKLILCKTIIIVPQSLLSNPLPSLPILCSIHSNRPNTFKKEVQHSIEAKHSCCARILYVAVVRMLHTYNRNIENSSSCPAIFDNATSVPLYHLTKRCTKRDYFL